MSRDKLEKRVEKLELWTGILLVSLFIVAISLLAVVRLLHQNL